MSESVSTSLRTYEQAFSVPFDYPVHFGRDLLGVENDLLATVLERRGGTRPHKLMVFVDAGLSEARPGLVQAVRAWTERRPSLVATPESPLLVSGGEHAKNGWSDVRRVMEALGRHHICRQSTVLAIGGGSVLDMVGFAVSIVHRGVRLIRMPTTVLSQCDGGVGVKTGMNEHSVKNFAGTFAPPFAVLNDASLLTTLPQPHWIGGVAEAFKVAAIKDADFLDWLVVYAARLRDRDLDLMEQAVYRSAVLHLEHIRRGNDPFEFGSSRPLDFGHWAAHQIEVMSSFAMGHGQAVAVGVALDTVYAAYAGFVAEADMRRLVSGLLACGLPVWHESLERRSGAGAPAIFDGLEAFREHLGGSLTLAMPCPFGKQREIHEVDRACMERAMGWLKTVQQGQTT